MSQSDRNQVSGVRILGIDPGSRLTGYGIIEVQAGKACWVNSGCIRTGNGSMAARLKAIAQSMQLLLEEHQPQEVCIEKIFMHRNPDSALKLGHARGAAISVIAIQDLAIHEYAAREIKKAIVGKGNASKDQVQHMVKTLLGLSKYPQEDAADALAVALCHAHMRETLQHYATRSKALEGVDVENMRIFKRSSRKRSFRLSKI